MLLTISIPTFNRPNNLKNVVKVISFLEFNKDIIINIHDNSYINIQSENKKNIPDWINYYPNSNNIGYAGNIAKAIEAANSKYIWFLPDDDEFLFNDFTLVINRLRTRNVDILALPFEVQSTLGESHITNSFGNFKMGYLLDSLNERTLNIYDYLPSAIVKLDLLKKGLLFSLESKNTYFHTLCLLNGSDGNERVLADLPNKLIIYKNPTEVRFDVIDLLESKIQLLNLISSKYGINCDAREALLMISKWLFFAGINSNSKLLINSSDFYKLIHKSFSYKSLLSLMLLLASRLPYFTRSFTYSIYKNIKSFIS